MMLDWFINREDEMKLGYLLWVLWVIVLLGSLLLPSHIWVMNGAIRITRYQYVHGYLGIFSKNFLGSALQLIAIHLVVNSITYLLVRNLIKRMA